MKTVIKTSIMMLAFAGLMAMLAGAAMAAAPAAPSDAMVAHPADFGQHADVHVEINPDLIDEAVVVPPDGSDTPDDGSDNPDDGSDTPDDGSDNPDDGSDNPGLDDGGDTPDDGSDNPGLDDGDQSGGEDTTITTSVPQNAYHGTSSNNSSSGKLPNTGTQLALLAAIAFMLGGGAYVARRVSSKRTR